MLNIWAFQSLFVTDELRNDGWTMIIGKTRGLLQFEIWWNAGPTFFVNKTITYFNCIDSLVAVWETREMHGQCFLFVQVSKASDKQHNNGSASVFLCRKVKKRTFHFSWLFQEDYLRFSNRVSNSVRMQWRPNCLFS